MTQRLWLVGFVILFPAAAYAQEPPEELLPATTQVYLRWDGIAAHRPAFERSALGKMLKGDTGTFVSSLTGVLQDTLSNVLTTDKLLQGLPPDRLQKLQLAALEAPRVLSLLGEHGLLVGAEIRGLLPPDANVTLIVPQAGANFSAIASAMRLLGGTYELDLVEAKVEGQTVYHLNMGLIHVSGWAAGRHGVVTVGTATPEQAVKRLQVKGPRLTSNPLFQKIKNFSQFETITRGFVDVPPLLKFAKVAGKDVGKIISRLGLDQVASASMVVGYEGEAERQVIDLEFAGPRQGLFALLPNKPFRLADIPPLPPDVNSWSMITIDADALYDMGFFLVETINSFSSPEDQAKAKNLRKQVDDALSLSLHYDLLAALDNQVVFYSSPVEAPFLFGQTLLLKTKDGPKLLEGLTKSAKALGKLAGMEVRVKKKHYRGVEMREFQVRQEGFFVAPTIAVRDGWLAIGLVPQPVQGFILRSTKELPSWKPEATVLEAFGRLPKEFVYVSVTDPRPTIKQLLTFAPLIGGGFKSFFPESKFDVSGIPNAYEATRYLFPNVSVVTFQGNNIRKENRASLPLPIDLTGLDSVGILVLFSFAMQLF